MQKVNSFDIEQADPFPEDGQIKDYAALGITCAANLRSNEIWKWLSDDNNLDNPIELFWAGMYGNEPTDRMNTFELAELIEFLLEEAKQGYPPLTWNGASYDFRMLAEAMPDYRQQIKDSLVMPGIDMMFHFLSCAGHFLGLDAACKGQGISGKILDPILSDGSSMNGQKAVEYWSEHWQAVLDYVSGDVVAPVLLFEKVQEQDGVLGWMAKSGNSTSFDLKTIKIGRYDTKQVLPEFKWLTVNECLTLPDPYQAWMTNPTTKRDFLSYWL